MHHLPLDSKPNLAQILKQQLIATQILTEKEHMERSMKAAESMLATRSPMSPLSPKQSKLAAMERTNSLRQARGSNQPEKSSPSKKPKNASLASQSQASKVVAVPSEAQRQQSRLSKHSRVGTPLSSEREESKNNNSIDNKNMQLYPKYQIKENKKNTKRQPRPEEVVSHKYE